MRTLKRSDSGKPYHEYLTNKPMNFPVIGLPEHLEARIVAHISLSYRAKAISSNTVRINLRRRQRRHYKH